MAIDTTINYDERFDKIDAQLDQIANAVVRGFNRTDKALEEKADKADMQRIYDLLDKIIKQQELDNDERLDRWVHGVADKIGYKLNVWQQLLSYKVLLP